MIQITPNARNQFADIKSTRQISQCQPSGPTCTGTHIAIQQHQNLILPLFNIPDFDQQLNKQPSYLTTKDFGFDETLSIPKQVFKSLNLFWCPDAWRDLTDANVQCLTLQNDLT